MHVVPDLPQLALYALVGPALERPAQVHPDQLAQHAGVHPLQVVLRYDHLSPPDLHLEPA
ncbi:hypothetical protein [Thermobaculum terrenum]|uniref:hypothetical protein n=1 Tax=Thermobaculum terrenum TaxID=166501 RepID=UPI001F49E59B|nr:hypothetical protein [Thermobaculum terrenum]